MDPSLGTGTGLVFPNRIDTVGGPFDFGAGNPVLSFSLQNVLGTFTLDLALLAAENGRSGARHLRAARDDAGQHAGRDPERLPDPVSDAHQLHDDGRVRRRHAAAVGDAADHRGRAR